MAATYLIAGAGLAGIEAAGAIRQRDTEGRIIIVGDEDLPFYSRIRLPELVTGAIEKDKLVVKKPAWYEERAIELTLGVGVVAASAEDHTATLSDGTSLPFDRLLIATGSHCFVPPFPGADLDGVHAVRSYRDAQTLREKAGEAHAIVVIGGGLLGLEMAAALATHGVAVTVVEIAPWLLPRQLDEAGAAVLQAQLEAKGLTFITGANVAAVEGEGTVSAVRLADGPTLPASFVVVSAGVRSNVALGRSLGCEVDRGIVVDEHMATSVADVFAAGDCAEFQGMSFGIWPVAEAQGRIAGLCMAGGEDAYEAIVPSNRLKVTGVDVFSAGVVTPEEGQSAEVTTSDGVYRKMVRDARGTLVGAILVGDMRDQRAIAKELAAGKR